MKRLWKLLPAPVRDRLRLPLYNRRHAPARFSLARGVYTTAFGGVTMRTADHPFDVVPAARSYLRRREIGTGEVAIDAGAFNGLLTIWFALRVGPAGRVIAVEPDEVNAARLRRNLALNPQIRNVEIESRLLWDGPGEVEFFPQGNVGSSAFWAPAGMAGVRRPSVTLDELVEAHGLARLDFVKMDIEGAEVRALRGATATLRRFRPEFAIASYHQVEGKPTYPDVEAFFHSVGYGCETVFQGGECLTYGWPL